MFHANGAAERALAGPHLLVLSCALLWGCAPDLRIGPGYGCDASCGPDLRCVDGVCSAAGVVPPWWDTGWRKRRRLTVSSSPTVPLPIGFEVRLSAELSPYAPLDQLRVVRWAGGGWTEKARVVEEVTATSAEQLWFALDVDVPPDTSNADYWVYLDNPGAGAPDGRPEEVFTLFYDSFDQPTIDLGRWAVSAASIDTGGSHELVLSAGESVRSQVGWAPGHAVDFLMVYDHPWASSSAGFQRLDDFVDLDPWMLWLDRAGDGTVVPDVFLMALGDQTSVSGPPRDPAVTYHLYTIDRQAGAVRFEFDGEPHYTRTLPNAFTDPLQIRFRNGGPSVTVMRFEMVRVRRTVDPAPTVTLGEEETRPP